MFSPLIHVLLFSASAVVFAGKGVGGLRRGEGPRSLPYVFYALASAIWALGKFVLMKNGQQAASTILDIGAAGFILAGFGLIATSSLNGHNRSPK